MDPVREQHHLTSVLYEEILKSKISHWLLNPIKRCPEHKALTIEVGLFAQVCDKINSVIIATISSDKE